MSDSQQPPEPSPNLLEPARDVDTWKLASLIPRPDYAAYKAVPLANRFVSQVGESFIKNLSRNDSQILMPFVISLVMGLRAGASVAAFSTYKDRNPKVGNRTAEQLDASELKEVEAEFYGILSSLLSNQFESHERLEARFREIASTLAANLNLANHEEVDTIQSWLASAVIGTWTAFETMAGDLWEQAVNHHPRGLATLRGSLSKKEAADARGDEHRTANASALTPRPAPEQKPADRSIKLKFLEEHGYDVSKVMGTVWREDMSFQTLRGIRDAYVRAFADDSEAVLGAINDPCFAALAAVRNVLVHRAGVVDQAYVDQTRGLPLLAGAKIGGPLELNGELTNALIARAVDKSVALIRAVDDWLKAHKN